MSRALSLLLLLTLTSCVNPLELGERRYREGNRVDDVRSVEGILSATYWFGLP